MRGGEAGVATNSSFANLSASSSGVDAITAARMDPCPATAARAAAASVSSARESWAAIRARSAT